MTARRLAVTIGLPAARCEAIAIAGHLLDVGQLSVPRHITDKPSILTVDEMELMRCHPGVGARLLARSPRFPQSTYSALAGFVEAGETLEQCVEREVQEGDYVLVDIESETTELKRTGFASYVRKEDRDTRQAEESFNKASGMKKGGTVSSASRRADGIAQRGKTKGRHV